MASSDFGTHDKIQRLGGLDLTILVSRIAEQHCIIFPTENVSSHMRSDIYNCCVDTFGLRVATVDCSSWTTVEDFNESLLIGDKTLVQGDDRTRARLDDYDRSAAVSLSDFSRSRTGSYYTRENASLDERRVADVVIASNLDLANIAVQTQVLELLRTKRIFTRAAMHTAPKDLLFIALVSRPDARLTHHLSDLFGISYVYQSPATDTHVRQKAAAIGIDADEVALLREASAAVYMAPDMIAFLHHVVIFMRMNRYIAGGVTPAATRMFRGLACALAVTQNLDFVTPSIVQNAAKRVYAHRIVLATAETERSLQWGSDPDAIRSLLKGMTIDRALENVLLSIEAPL